MYYKSIIRALQLLGVDTNLFEKLYWHATVLVDTLDYEGKGSDFRQAVIQSHIMSLQKVLDRMNRNTIKDENNKQGK